MPKVRATSFDVILPVDLAHWARDLSGLLREINVQPPKGGEHDWLENRVVMNELVRTLAETRALDLKTLCAAWLQQSSLSKVISLFIDRPAIWRTRARPALEVVAEIARDADTDTQTAFLARSVLCKNDFIVQLWQRGDEYRALVFDLLLAQNKRLVTATVSPNERKWQVIG